MKKYIKELNELISAKDEVHKILMAKNAQLEKELNEFKNPSVLLTWSFAAEVETTERQPAKIRLSKNLEKDEYYMKQQEKDDFFSLLNKESTRTNEMTFCID